MFLLWARKSNETEGKLGEEDTSHVEYAMSFAQRESYRFDR